MERAVEGAEPGEWIVGRGWHQDKWTVKEDILVDGIPVHDKLSAVSPNNPVMLIHTSGHGVYANQAAMDQANIKGDTVPPEGGEIVLKADGTPTGMMREAAQDGIRVWTALIISCKKSENNTWALVAKSKDEKNPNINWTPVTLSSKHKVLKYVIENSSWKKTYIEESGDLYDQIFSPNKHIFAFQEMSNANGKSQND
ncbi:MAG: amidohydrolase family protein, partial [Emcibacteraceae bacterium]|nr:amidohydrolase family protein [Emcibacteraceae bacterium]